MHGRHDKLSWKFFKPGTVVKFSCNPGYRLEGSSTSKCVLNKAIFFISFLVWNNAVPKCVKSKAKYSYHEIYHDFCLVLVAVLVRKISGCKIPIHKQCNFVFPGLY